MPSVPGSLLSWRPIALLRPAVQDVEGEVDPSRPVIKPVHQQSLFNV